MLETQHLNLFSKGAFMSKIKELEDRLEQLVNAHRAAAARTEAVVMCCRVIFPFIKIAPDLRAKMMTIAYDGLTEHMSKKKFDQEFQQAARASIEEIFDCLKT